MSKKTFVLCFNLKPANCSSNDPQYNKYHVYKKMCQWCNFNGWTWYQTIAMTLLSTSSTLKTWKNLCNSKLCKFQICNVYLQTHLTVAIWFLKYSLHLLICFLQDPKAVPCQRKSYYHAFMWIEMKPFSKP